MAQAHLMDYVDLIGVEILKEARLAVKRFKGINATVPKMTIEGPWLMNGFKIDVDEGTDAYPPLGSRFVSAGERKAKMEPIADSEMRVYFVFSGDALPASSPLTEGDLFGEAEPEEVEETAEDDE